MKDYSQVLLNEYSQGSSRAPNPGCYSPFFTKENILILRAPEENFARSNLHVFFLTTFFRMCFLEL